MERKQQIHNSAQTSQATKSIFPLPNRLQEFSNATQPQHVDWTSVAMYYY